MTNFTPVVSVCIPTYNRSARLVHALGSAIKQDYQKLEIIVLDNASTDDTQQVVANLSKNDPRIKYFRNSENIGATNNFNQVIRLANNEYCMWLADDDWLDPNYITCCMAELLSDPESALVSGMCEFFHSSKDPRFGQKITLQSKSKIWRLIHYYLWVGDNSIFYGIHRKSNVERVFIRRELGSDWFFMAAIAYLGKLKTIDSTYMHRCSEGSSADPKRLASELGEPSYVVAQPYLGVAIGARRDLINNDAVYSSSSKLTRHSVGLLLMLAIVVKKIILQSIYRVIRTRFQKK